jgi:hypothetical protein
MAMVFSFLKLLFSGCAVRHISRAGRVCVCVLLIHILVTVYFHGRSFILHFLHFLSIQDQWLPVLLITGDICWVLLCVAGPWCPGRPSLCPPSIPSQLRGWTGVSGGT